MKAVFITPYFYPRVGGLENYALEICKGLCQDFGWEVIVITSAPKGHNDSKELIFGLTVFRLKTDFFLSNTPVGFSWSQKIKKILIHEKPDVVNAHTPVPIISDFGVRAAKGLGIPVVLTYQNDIFKDNSIFRLISLMYSTLLGNTTLDLSDKIIVTSSHYAELSDKIRPLKSKVVVVPPGIHLRKPLTKLKTDYVLFVGQLDTTHQHKGLDYLISAFSLLPKKLSNLELIVVGKGNDIPRYKNLSKKLNLEKRVHFKGFVDDIDQYYAGALCLCLPSTSQSEGFGMVILEAAGQRTPSIASCIGGIPSALQDNQTGLLFSPRNAEAICSSIVQLASNPSLAKELGNAAYSRVKKEFTWEAQIQKTEKLFRMMTK